jgi:hypothetical protein
MADKRFRNTMFLLWLIFIGQSRRASLIPMRIFLMLSKTDPSKERANR